MEKSKTKTKKIKKSTRGKKSGIKNEYQNTKSLNQTFLQVLKKFWILQGGKIQKSKMERL